MRRKILDQLISDGRSRDPVIRATNLATGADRLIYPGAKGEPDDISAAAAGTFRSDKSRLIETEDGPVFLDVHNPALRLTIVGAVHITQALAPMARIAGYDVFILDPRGAFASDARFPGYTLSTEWPEEALAARPPDARTGFVVLTHDPKIDDVALDIAIKSGSFYIGALGSKKTHAARHERLLARGFGEGDIANIHGPIGLDIGARSPAEIAVSIMAEMTNRLRGGRVGR